MQALKCSLGNDYEHSLLGKCRGGVEGSPRCLGVVCFQASQLARHPKLLDKCQAGRTSPIAFLMQLEVYFLCSRWWSLSANLKPSVRSMWCSTWNPEINRVLPSRANFGTGSILRRFLLWPSSCLGLPEGSREIRILSMRFGEPASSEYGGHMP